MCALKDSKKQARVNFVCGTNLFHMKNVFFVKQDSEKWNTDYESEEKYDTKMSNCETDYLKIWRNLFQKSVIGYLRNVQLK